MKSDVSFNQIVSHDPDSEAKRFMRNDKKRFAQKKQNKRYRREVQDYLKRDRNP